MANRMIYTRTYSNSSAGQLISGKAAKGDPLSDASLLEEFPKHADEWNRVPTSLVSGSDRIIDSVKRAFDKHYKDGESPEDIWIAFIEVPSATKEATVRIHSAKELAGKCELPEPNKFSHEVVFEWAIPEKYVVHSVSLQTLMRRGLRERHFLQLTTAEVRRSTAKEFQQSDPWEIGVALGVFAKTFGARAPLNWVSHQLFHDCVWVKIIDDDVARLKYAPGCTEIVGFQFFYDLEGGIDDTLYDWWLRDIDFFRDYEEFKEWRDTTEDRITWDLIEFWETWHDVDCDGTVKELSAKEELAYDKARDNLSVKHEIERAAIKAEAVKLGL